MSIIKSFSVGDGDMFYIDHNSDNFSIIDCCMDDGNKEAITQEIKDKISKKGIIRFISTHPDEDHLQGLGDETRGCAGINFKWPITTDENFKESLSAVTKGKGFNNISPIFTYSVENNVVAMWMGDMEQAFLDKIKDQVSWPKVDILFAPHHGRASGKVSNDVLEKLEPKIIVIGEAPSKYLNYYQGYNTITQNSAGDIVFECIGDKVHVYVSQSGYRYDTSFLVKKGIQSSEHGTYLGSFTPKGAE